MERKNTNLKSELSWIEKALIVGGGLVLYGVTSYAINKINGEPGKRPTPFEVPKDIDRHR